MLYVLMIYFCVYVDRIAASAAPTGIPLSMAT